MNASESNSGISPAVLVLSVLLTAAITAAVTLGLRPAPSAPAASSAEPVAVAAPAILTDGKVLPAAEVAAVAAFTQKDDVEPGVKYSGQIYYPIPFRSPPSLKITCAKRIYEISKQDESGFIWLASINRDDFKDDLKPDTIEAMLRNSFANLSGENFKTNLRFEPFTWEAKGIRGTRLSTPFEQTGTFQTLADTSGEVVFPIPYAAAANVELSGRSEYVVITECKATGFKWQNKPDATWKNFANGTVTWKARGVRSGD